MTDAKTLETQCAAVLLVVGRLFSDGTFGVGKNGIASADRSPLFIATGIVCSMLVGVVLIKCCLYAKRIMNKSNNVSSG